MGLDNQSGEGFSWNDPYAKAKLWSHLHNKGISGKNIDAVMGLLDVDRQVKQARDDINLSLYRKALAGGNITEADLQLAKLASDDKTMGAMLAGRIMGTKDFWDYQKRQEIAMQQAALQQRAALQRFAMQQALSNQSYQQRLGALKYSAGLKQQAENDKRRSIYEAALASGMSEAEALQAAMGIGNRGRSSSRSGSSSKDRNDEKKGYSLGDAMANAVNQVNSGDHRKERKDIDFARQKIEKLAADGDISPSEAEELRAKLNVMIELYSKGLNMQGQKVENPKYDKVEDDEELSEYTD